MLSICACAALLLLPSAQEEETPTPDYTTRQIQGWTVRVHPELARPESELGRRVLEHLAHDLHRIARVLPEAALRRLRGITLWMELDLPGVPGGAYHPSRAWLVEHGYDPALARSIQFGNAENFLSWSRVQPWMVLHELAHAYHHQVLGKGHAGIRGAYEAAVASGAYESVLYYSGEKRRAYALKNVDEYFAELTEAYFGTNDFYPFVRPEIAEIDPGGMRVIREAWEAPPGLRLVTKPNAVRVVRGGTTLLEYLRGHEGLKPYALHLRTPAGFDVLRDAPHDHEHHHALMFAIGVDEVDHWGERVAQIPGRQLERSCEPIEAPACGFTQAIEWLDSRDKGVQLVERRCLELVVEGEPEATLLTWRSRLELPPGVDSARLWGAHYFGLGMRFAESMDGSGAFLYASGSPGEVVRGDERLTRSTWSAYHGEVDGRPVTVAGFDDPRNPRHPAAWFTMTVPFTYLTATLDLQAQPLVLHAIEALDLRYGVAVWDGHVERDSIEELYRRWAARE